MGNLNLMNVVVGIVLVFLFGVVMFVPSENYNEVTGEIIRNDGCGLITYSNPASRTPDPICSDGEYCLSSHDYDDVIVFGARGGRGVLREDIGTSCVQGSPAPCVDSDSSGRSEPDSSSESIFVGGSASMESYIASGEAVDHNDITYARYSFYARQTKVDSCSGRNILREAYCAAGRIPVVVDVTCPEGKICVTEGGSARCAVNQEPRSNLRSTASSRRSTSNLRQTIVRGSRHAASRRT